MSFASTLPDRPLTLQEREAFERLQSRCGSSLPKSHVPEFEDGPHYRPGQKKRYRIELRWCWICGAVHAR